MPTLRAPANLADVRLITGGAAASAMTTSHRGLPTCMDLFSFFVPQGDRGSVQVNARGLLVSHDPRSTCSGQ